MTKRANITVGAFMFAGLALLSTSCTKEKEGCTDSKATNYDAEAKKDNGTCIYPSFTVVKKSIDGNEYQVVSGSFDKDFTFTAANNWMLSGGVKVLDGATLKIEAGTMIYAEAIGTPFLAIQQGGKINAAGTSDKPIVFTSSAASPKAGDWGGIIINGKAKINTGATAQGEGNTGTYGGTNDADNSGVLTYVRVEYAGKNLGVDNELNGFSFNGVGSGTTVHHIQAYKGADDGIEFFGGTVSVKYAVSTGNSDDSFDWTHGWSGNGQFWVVQQMPGAGDRGIEADNQGNDNKALPMSNPTLSNVTIVGANNTGKQAVKFREGTKVKLYNAIITGFPKRGVQVEHDVTLENMESGGISVLNCVIDNINPFVYTKSKQAGESEGKPGNPTNPFENDPSNTTTIGSSSLTGYVGVDATNAFDPTSLGNSWFEAGTFRGAVDANNDWTSGWTKAL